MGGGGWQGVTEGRRRVSERPRFRSTVRTPSSLPTYLAAPDPAWPAACAPSRRTAGATATGTARVSAESSVKVGPWLPWLIWLPWLPWLPWLAWCAVPGNHTRRHSARSFPGLSAILGRTLHSKSLYKSCAYLLPALGPLVAGPAVFCAAVGMYRPQKLKLMVETFHFRFR